ncbi:cytochrome P450 monooxygenase [Pochonia chlamydosporia 170]|uniref:Cytochrome P450 monooxygenase n=1 Tax=Pochonia chlamydosporia 170 TaxID=1380566 RepID=A0A179FHT7_METCM|nr:cytochrome P450 monooxygenase [Pochonia chlamydosporia 170]OAQ64573.1 cytochrome P450 monooxygenase [Pochonia chlamydosporia 170]
MAYATIAIAAVVLIYLSQFLNNLVRNMINGWTIGLPMIIVPVDHTQLLWLILAPLGRRRLQQILPRRLWSRLAITIFGWEFHEKLRPFEQFATSRGKEKGMSFLLAGFGHLELWTADPVAVQDILLRHRDFEVPHSLEFALGQYGPNVLTTNGDQWTRHRRIVSSVIDERISKTVFEESIEQADGLLGEIEASTDGTAPTETRHLFDMLKKITIHVLLTAGMGRTVAWQDDKEQKPEPGYRMSHIKSLTTVVTSIAGFGLLPTWLLVQWPEWLSGHQKMTSIGHAKMEVEKRSKSILDQERTSRARGEESTSMNNIMVKLLDASEEGKDSGQPLTEAEMISNLFIFTAAGFETTATLLTYATVLLARYPAWQDWLLEEVDEITPANDQPSYMEYSAIFPRATRTMAFMFETLRLYSPVCHVHRETASPQVVRTETGSVQLPANTRIYVNSVAVHLLPIWRDINRASDPPFYKPDPDNIADEYAFRPSRWINQPNEAQRIYHPPKGTWIPWAMGPRVCPGQKMAQVEFTAVMLTLLRRHRIDVVPLVGEGRKETEDRLDAALCDSSWVTVLQMNNVFDPKPNEGLPMKFSKRR